MSTAAEIVTLGRMVALTALFPSPLNPRKRFTPASLEELTANIQKRGEVIMPALVRTKGARFEIIDGERRYRAATAAQNIEQMPAIIRDDLTDGEVIEIMLVSSLQKQELTPLEEAAGFQSLIHSNKAKYSAGYIADRISRTEKFVWDRMKLLDLIPILKTLLDAERIHVGHAEILAKLKPADQERALEIPDHRHGVTGLWQEEHARLELDEEDRDDPSPKNLYRGLKPVTVKELESWVAHHVRFDVDHMASAAPLQFADVKAQVDEAQARPGRGRKVIAITHAYHVDDDAKDPNERTYGSQSWKRADGAEKSKTCEHSVLGTVVAGAGYGTSLEVCINRDKCRVHFGDVLREREKTTTLRTKGKGGQAAQREEVARQKEAKAREAREADERAWKELRPRAVKAVTAYIAQQPIAKLLPLVAKVHAHGAPIKKSDDLIRVLATRAATNQDYRLEWLAQDARRFGFDLRTWVATQQKAAAAASKTASPAKASAKPAAKKATPAKPAKKKAKKR